MAILLFPVVGRYFNLLGTLWARSGRKIPICRWTFGAVCHSSRDIVAFPMLRMMSHLVAALSFCYRVIVVWINLRWWNFKFQIKTECLYQDQECETETKTETRPQTSRPRPRPIFGLEIGLGTKTMVYYGLPWSWDLTKGIFISCGCCKHWWQERCVITRAESGVRHAGRH